MVDKFKIVSYKESDYDGIIKGYESSSKESIYYRFHCNYKMHAIKNMITRLTSDIDNKNIVYLVSKLNDDVSGEGLYIKISEDTAEVSLIVFDEYKGLGIAKNIILRLADVARHNGIKYFEFHVLIDNIPMRKLLKSFTIEEKSGVNAFGKIIMKL